MRFESRLGGVAAGLLILLCSTLWLLWPGIHGPFLFDDIPNFQNLGDLGCRFDRVSLGTYLSVFTGTPGRPLAALSFLLNDCAWPSEAMMSFKLTNLWLHLLNGVLVFGLARMLARLHDARHADWIALLAAALWLLSPIQVSAIFLTVQRMTLLAGTFAFAGLWTYAVLLPRATTGWRTLFAVAVLGVATLLAFLSKESGALLPLFALVLHATLLRPTLQSLPSGPRRQLWTASMAAVALLALALASQWSSITDFSGRPFTQYERVLTEGRVLLQYLGLIVAPRLSSSGLYNDDYVISHGWLDPVTTLLAWVLIAGLLVGSLLLRRRMPLFAFAVLWYFAGHAMESSVLSLELYFEHRNYVPLFGIAYATAVTVSRAQGKLALPARAGLALWLLLAAGVLHLQANVWGNWAALSTIWRAENPQSLRAQQQYGDFLYRNGERAAARAVFQQAFERGVAPLNSGLQLIHLDCMAGSFISDDRISAVSRRLRHDHVDGGTTALLTALRTSVELQECRRDFDASDWLDWTQRALDNPTGTGLQRQMRLERAYLFVHHSRLDAAMSELEHAWAYDHEPRIAFYGAALLASAGLFDDARAWAQRPLTQPGNRFKAWLTGTRDQAHRLIAAIDQGQREQSKSDSPSEPPMDP